MTNLILKRQLAKNKKKGFTLIELIVVIVIIAIIAAIAVPALTRYIESANARAAQANAHNIQVVLQAEATDFYPATPNPLMGSSAAAFFVAPPAIPTHYLNGDTFTNTVDAILAYAGISMTGSTLTDISFEGHKLTGFVYVHQNGSKVTYDDGVYTLG